MTKEQATVDTWDLDYQIGVMQAFKDRRQIEFRFRDTFNKAWHASVVPNWNWQHLEYRIKPTATLRAWTADEVPLGAFMRSKEDGWKSLILAVDSNGRILVPYRRIHLEDGLEHYEHSLDGGKTWLPCGVVEEAKP